MGIFEDAAEKKRKDALKALEDKRFAFAQHLSELGLHSDKALYVQVEGGFHGIALCGDTFLYLTGPGPMSDEDYTVSKYSQISVQCEDIFIPSEGMGGILGFGKKGGRGFRFILSFPDGTQGDIELVSGQNTVLEVMKGKDPVFDLKRRRGFSNVVWDFAPMESHQIEILKKRWLLLLGEKDD